jgi:hypothetical protein
MNANRINSLIATAFNLAAASDPSLKRVHPSGMSPAVADKLPRAVRIGWIESYLRRYHSGQFATPPYSGLEAQSALDLLRGWATPLTA